MSRKVVQTWTGPGNRDGVIHEIEPVENARHTVKGNIYLEWWYFDAILETGHVVVGFLQASELLSRKPGVELHVYKPSGEKLSVIKRYETSDITISDEVCDVWVGKNHAEVRYPDDGGLPVYELFISEDNLEARLTFTVEVPGWRPGEGKTIYGRSGYFAWIVPIPRARVEGTIKIDDETIKARGVGYHDHNWGTADMKKILTHWYWGRIYADDFTFIYAYVRTNRRFGNVCSKPLMIAYGDKVIMSTGEWELVEGDPVFNEVANRHYPKWIKIEKEGEFSLRLDVREIIDAHDFLENFPRPLKWFINKTFGRPGYLRFRSQFSLKVHHNGTLHQRGGKTLHEMVALK